MAKIEVTQEDINNAVPEEADRCPIALAMNRVLGGPFYVYPEIARYSTAWEVSLSGVEKGLVLPEEAGDFATSFDCGDPVNPFSFEIDPERIPTDAS